MGNLLTFDNPWDTSYSNSLFYTPSEKTYRSVKEASAPYLTASGTAATAETWLLDKLYFEFQELIARTQVISELDIPDVFTLRPLATQRITLKIREIKPAKFYYVKDIDDDEE
jgi:hypothetical protein